MWQDTAQAAGRRASWLGGFERGLSDVRRALRWRRADSRVNLFVAAVLALATGLFAAMLTLVSDLWWRNLEVDRGDRLVYVYGTDGNTIHAPSFRDRWSALFSGVTSHAPQRLILAGPAGSAQAIGEVVEANYFATLGVLPSAGRLFVPADDIASGDRSIVISHDLWMRQFRGDPGIVGQALKLDGREFQVVGVAAPRFKGLMAPWEPSVFWVTFRQFHGPAYEGSSTCLVARLADGTSAAQAQRTLRPSGAAPVRDRPRYKVLSATHVVTPVDPERGFEIVGALSIAGVSLAGLFLSIALANSIGLIATVARQRKAEFATRSALGAGMPRLCQQLLAEALLFGVVSGLAGLWIADLLLRAYTNFSPARYLVSSTTSGRTVAVVLLLVAVHTITVAAVFASEIMQLDRKALVLRLQERTTGRGRKRLLWFLAPQVVLATACLLLAAVHLRDFAEVRNDSAGFTADNVVVLKLSYWSRPRGEASPPPSSDVPAHETSGYRGRAFFAGVREKAASLPGVLAAGLASKLPLELDGSPRPVVTRTAFADPSKGTGRAFGIYASEGYFAALAIPVLQGRDFGPADGPESAKVAIVSRALASRVWPGQDPVGQDIAVQLPSEPPDRLEWRRVVGVVGDVSPVIATRAEYPILYTPTSQIPFASSFPLLLVTRTNRPLQDFALELRNSVTSSYALAEVSGVQPLDARIETILYPRTAVTGLLTVCATAGLALVFIGLYGSLAHTISLRERELAIRSALGATRRDLLTTVLRAPGLLLLASVPLTLAIGVPLLRLTNGLVGVAPDTPVWLLGAVMATVWLIGLASCLSPAWRQTRSIERSTGNVLKI